MKRSSKYRLLSLWVLLMFLTGTVIAANNGVNHNGYIPYKISSTELNNHEISAQHTEVSNVKLTKSSNGDNDDDDDDDLLNEDASKNHKAPGKCVYV